MRRRRTTSRRRTASPELDRIDEMVKEIARDLGVKATPCGLNADWSVEAWHLSEGRPNRTPGDYYLLDTENGELVLVQRYYDDFPHTSPDEVVDIESAPATESGARKLLQLAQRLERSATRRTAATGTPDEAKFNVNMAIGELNLWGEQLEERYGDWRSMPSDLKRDFGQAIDLLDEVERVIERLESGKYKQLARASRRTASDPSTWPEPEFDLGDRVQIMDGNEVLDEGEISYVGTYDDYIGQYRYKVKTPTNRKTWNENSLRRASRRTAADEGYLVSMTYETWTPEDIEFGETDDKGFMFEDEWFPSLDDLDGDSLIRQRYWSSWSDSHPGPRSWVNSEDEVDMRTGERTQYSLFVERADGQPLSKDEVAELGRELGVR